MDKIREERDLLKWNQEKEDQWYWALKKQVYEFEAQFVTLLIDDNSLEHIIKK
jgi:hypothetical protein